MHVYYISILLFAIPLNILVSSHKKTRTTRSLCECELYAPANYDNDPQMKEVIENFNKQTQQRFHEYDDRMIVERKQCKDKCDKEIQKIILKDKIDKELMDKFATLQTDIQSDAIPTCVCEKSLVDKVEKGCLRCGGVLGGIAPSVGILGGLGTYGWKSAATAAAIDFATKAGIKEGTAKGIEVAIKEVIRNFSLHTLGGKPLKAVITSETYKKPMFFVGEIMTEYNRYLDTGIDKTNGVFSVYEQLLSGDSFNITKSISATARNVATKAGKAATEMTTQTTNTITAEKTSEILNITTNYFTAIISSVVAILIIVLIMVIIYLILRYRRKKKMKKKLQYIKLLEE
ncbi:rifin [Plasmodium reichenowi]|uniref:Rifin n=1 Tax=Plasmodium reichenowi TaxID=5854 RepID=A0A060RMC9_PLARE|nr:rifin [Plasmodium reichenowi]